MSKNVKNVLPQKPKSNGKVSHTVRSYADEPFFIQKAEETAETLKRVGLPNEKK